MAKTETERAVAARSDVPPCGVVIRAAQEYMARGGMGTHDLGSEVGYSESAIRHLLYGTYPRVASTDIYIRRAVWTYMEEHPLLGEDARLPAKLLPTRDTRLILERIEQAREHARIIVIEGPPGTSKTTALRWTSAERHRSGFKDTFYIRARTSITGFALARRLASLLGANANATRDRLISNVVRKLQQIPQAVLLIDEAQNLLDGHAERSSNFVMSLMRRLAAACSPGIGISSGTSRTAWGDSWSNGLVGSIYATTCAAWGKRSWTRLRKPAWARRSPPIFGAL